MGLKPQWLTKHLFTVVTANGPQHVFASKNSLNSQLSSGLSSNKYLMRTILSQHNLPNIPYFRPEDQAEAELFLGIHGRLIAKPNKGSGSKDIHHIKTPTDLSKLVIENYILEKYIEGKELRYLTLNGEVVAVYHSDYGNSIEELRELKCIAYGQTEWNQQLVALSKKVVNSVNLRFGCVDYLVEADGTVYILEVNSAPDLKWFHNPSSGPAVNVARLFLEALVAEATPLPSPLS